MTLSHIKTNLYKFYMFKLVYFFLTTLFLLIYNPKQQLDAGKTQYEPSNYKSKILFITWLRIMYTNSA